ncbi:MAG: sugar ABC transporter permease, partial [Meiothermus sp.]|nr:sugar ABC transporter permease [Meiothermus sp.]
MNHVYFPKPAGSGQLLRLARLIWRYRLLYLMLLPGLLYFLVFRYWPLWNAQIAFKDFQPTLGVWGSPWVGLQHFQDFFSSYYFGQLLANTLIISLAKIALGIPPAILLAIALHETSRRFLAQVVQTMSYL